MISLATNRVIKGDTGVVSPPVAVPSALPPLLGSTVYSFMCHHSLPSMLSPVKDKRRLSTLLALDYFIILTFYLTLSITAVFAFPHIEDLYTLNFEPKPGDPAFMEIVDYFLALFPVFTLTATFPIMAVTLRNNIQVCFFFCLLLFIINYLFITTTVDLWFGTEDSIKIPSHSNFPVPGPMKNHNAPFGMSDLIFSTI